MKGMNTQDGQSLSGSEHLRQSLVDILTTPVGARVMQRNYGSDLFTLIDQPINAMTLIDIYAATAKAIRLFEPRYKLQRVNTSIGDGNGQISIDLVGIDLTTNTPTTFEGIRL